VSTDNEINAWMRGPVAGLSTGDMQYNYKNTGIRGGETVYFCSSSLVGQSNFILCKITIYLPDFLCGVKYQEYCADFFKYLYVRGAFTNKLQKVNIFLDIYF
jgi:hypothetical protein